MKSLIGYMVFALSSFAFAGDGGLGTKSDPIPAAQGAAPATNLMPLLQMALAVGIVLLLLKVWIPKLVSKVNKGIKSGLDGGIKIEEAATFGGGTLNVVSVKGRTLLLCVGTQGVTFLADLTDKSPTPLAPTFLDLVEKASQPVPRRSAVIEEPSDSSPKPLDDIEAALTRARLLSA